MWGEVRHELAARQVRQRARALWAVGWFSTGRSACAPRATEIELFGYGNLKTQPPTWRGVGEEKPRPTAWSGARPTLPAKPTTPSPQRAVRAPWAVGWFSTGRSARGPRATELERFGYFVSKPQPPTWRGVGEEEPFPKAWGRARPALAAKITTPSPQRAVRASWVVGWLFTGRSARGPRATEQDRLGHVVPEPQPLTWRGVGEEEPQTMALGGARCELAAQTTTPSPPARTCSVGGRLVLHGANRAWVARHGT